MSLFHHHLRTNTQMDINAMLRGVLPTLAANASASAENASAPDRMSGNMVETLLPLLGLRGFVPMYGFIGNWLGIDVTWILTFFGMIWAVNKLGRQVYGTVYGFVTENLMSKIHISSNDDIYTHLMRWLALQPRLFNSRSLTAETISKTAWEDEDESNVSKDNSGTYLNFSNQEARAVSRNNQLSVKYLLTRNSHRDSFLLLVSIASAGTVLVTVCIASRSPSSMMVLVAASPRSRTGRI